MVGISHTDLPHDAAVTRTSVAFHPRFALIPFVRYSMALAGSQGRDADSPGTFGMFSFSVRSTCAEHQSEAM